MSLQARATTVASPPLASTSRTEGLPLKRLFSAPWRVVLVVTVITAAVAWTPLVDAAPSATVVINELQVQGAAGAADEFVELYNPTLTVVDIGGWRVRRSS